MRTTTAALLGIFLALATAPVVRAACGDGAVDGTDVCDDGNLLAGDGCNAACGVEPGYTCAQDTGGLSHCRPLDTIFVSASTGSDATGNGAATLRYQTLTKALAEVSVAGTTVRLAPGAYGAGPAQAVPFGGLRIAGENTVPAPVPGGAWPPALASVASLTLAAGSDLTGFELRDLRIAGALTVDAVGDLDARRVRLDGGLVVVSGGYAPGPAHTVVLEDARVGGAGVRLPPAATAAVACSVDVRVERTEFWGIAGRALSALGTRTVRLRDSGFRNCATQTGAEAAAHVGVGLSCAAPTSALEVSGVVFDVVPPAALQSPCASGIHTASLWVDGASSIVGSFAVNNVTTGGSTDGVAGAAHCVAVRASDVSDAALMPFGYTPLVSDLRKFVRELARFDNNLAIGAWHDVVRGPPANDPLLASYNFCDALCPVLGLVNATAPAVAESDFRATFDLHKAGAGHAGDFLLGQNSCARTGPTADAAHALGTLRTLAGFTVELWFRKELAPPPAAPGGELLVAAGDTLRVWLDSTHVRASATLGGLPTPVAAATGLVLSDWYHVAVTYDGTALRMVLDGAEVDVFPHTGTLTAPVGAPELLVGCGVLAPLSAYVGRIDEVRVWSRARTAADIAADSTRNLDANTLGLVAAYQFDRLGWEPTSLPPYVETVYDYAGGGTALDLLFTNGTHALSDAPITNGQVRFYAATNHIANEAITVDLFPYPDSVPTPGLLSGVRAPSTLASRAPFVGPWSAAWTTGAAPFESPDNVLQPPHTWTGWVRDTPLRPLAAPLAFEASTVLTRALSLDQLLAGRPHPQSGLPQVPPVSFVSATGAYEGTLHLTATQAASPFDESAVGPDGGSAEVIRRAIAFTYSVAPIGTDPLLSGIMVAFRTDALYFDIDHTSLIFVPSGELEVCWVTRVHHVDQLAGGEQTTRLGNITLSAPQDPGSPALHMLPPADPPCMHAIGADYVGEYFSPNVPLDTARWSGVTEAGNVRVDACPGAAAGPDRLLRLPDASDALYTLTDLPPHTSVRVSLRLVAVGNWTGDADDGVFKLAVDGSGLLHFTTLTTDPALTAWYPADVGDSGGRVAPPATAFSGVCIDDAPPGARVAVFEVSGLNPADAIDHDDASLTLRFRLITPCAGCALYVDNIVVSTVVDPDDMCVQRWCATTSGEQTRLDFVGNYDLAYTPYVRGEPRIPDCVTARLGLDAYRSAARNETDVEAGKLACPDALALYGDANVTMERYSFVFKERIYAKLTITVPPASVPLYRVRIDQVFVCGGQFREPDAFDPASPDTTGCSTPRIGLVTQQVYDRDPLATFTYKHEFDASVIGFPPLSAPTEAGVAFNAQPLITDHQTLYLEVRYTCVLQPGECFFEDVNEPGTVLPEGTRIVFHPNGNMTLADAPYSDVILFLNGVPVIRAFAYFSSTGWSVTAGAVGTVDPATGTLQLAHAPRALPHWSHGGTQYTGPAVVGPFGNIYVDDGGTYQGEQLFCRDIDPLPMYQQDPVNTAMRLDSLPGSRIDVPYGPTLVEPWAETTVEWQLQLPTPPDPCAPGFSPCGAGATCTSTGAPPAAVCTCPPGTLGDPLVACYDDPCDPPGAACGTGAVCSLDAATPPGAVCACPPGTLGVPEIACYDDPCDPTPCAVGALCAPDAFAPPSAVCTCPAGTIGNPLTTGCYDNPCDPDPCGVDADCAPSAAVPPTAVCLCDPGEVGDPLVQCFDNPCLPDPCGSGALCAPDTAEPPNAVCTCPPAEIGDPLVACYDNPCDPHPCGGGATCTPDASTPPVEVCTCPPGTIGDPLANCYDDPCNPDPCGTDALCAPDAAAPPTAVCTCAPGDIGDPLVVCYDDPCDPDPCGVGADCAPKPGDPLWPMCTCPAGTVGDPTVECFDDPCAPFPCHANATCASDFTTSPPAPVANCTCLPGYTGDGVTTCAPPDLCLVSPPPCGTGAQCTVDMGSVVCACPPGTIGVPEIACYDDPCDPDPCGTGAQCAPDPLAPTSPVCTCAAGEIGDPLVACYDDPCAPDPCGTDATCTPDAATPPAAVCACPAGTIGNPLVACTDDPCDPYPCGTGADCLPDPLDPLWPVCSCPAGTIGIPAVACYDDPCDPDPCESDEVCTASGATPPAAVCTESENTPSPPSSGSGSEAGGSEGAGSEGSADGESEGSADGESEGSEDAGSGGSADGESEGSADGESEGSADGESDGSADGESGGSEDEESGGSEDEESEGSADGESEGSADGESEGSEDTGSGGSEDEESGGEGTDAVSDENFQLFSVSRPRVPGTPRVMFADNTFWATGSDGVWTATQVSTSSFAGCRVRDEGAGGVDTRLECRRTHGALELQTRAVVGSLRDRLHHLAVVTQNDAGTLRLVLYVDGQPLVPQLEVTAPAPALQSDWAFSDADGVDMRWGEDTVDDALLDEVRVWTVARTPTQIDANHNALITGTQLQYSVSRLQTYLRFDDEQSLQIGGTTGFYEPVTLHSSSTLPHGVLVNEHATPADLTRFVLAPPPPGFAGYAATSPAFAIGGPSRGGGLGRPLPASPATAALTRTHRTHVSGAVPGDVARADMRTEHLRRSRATQRAGGMGLDAPSSGLRGGADVESTTPVVPGGGGRFNVACPLGSEFSRNEGACVYVGSPYLEAHAPDRSDHYDPYDHYHEDGEIFYYTDWYWGGPLLGLFMCLLCCGLVWWVIAYPMHWYRDRRDYDTIVGAPPADDVVAAPVPAQSPVFARAPRPFDFAISD